MPNRAASRMRGSPNFAERKERARARRSSSTLDKIGTPTPAPRRLLGVLDPARSGMARAFRLSQRKEGTMITLYDHIQELRAELRGCYFTRRERAAVEAELAEALAAGI
jgi:hypothetical protein